MQLTLRDDTGEKTIEVEWSGWVAAYDLWIPHDDDFQGPNTATADVLHRIDYPEFALLAVDLEIGGVRGAGLVTLKADGDVSVEAVPDGRSFFLDEETEIIVLDALKPLPEIAASDKWYKASGGKWVHALDYLEAHPETVDWYYATSSKSRDADDEPQVDD